MRLVLLLLLIINPIYTPQKHPGGDEVIISEGGKDATEAFDDIVSNLLLQ